MGADQPITRDRVQVELARERVVWFGHLRRETPWALRDWLALTAGACSIIAITVYATWPELPVFVGKLWPQGVGFTSATLIALGFFALWAVACIAGLLSHRLSPFPTYARTEAKMALHRVHDDNESGV